MAGRVDLTDGVAAEPELLESRRAPVPSRRRHALWVALAMVVVAAAGSRPVADWLAAVQTRHVVEAYAVESALRASRAGTLTDLQFRLVAGEEKLFADTVAAMNREQAKRLRYLAKTLQDGLWWTVDREVRRTSDQVRAALVNEADGLERPDASAVNDLVSLDDATSRALFALDDPVQRLAARHGVTVPSRRAVRFAAADALRARLSAPIRAKVPLRLVLTVRGDTTVIDLRDGHVTTVRDDPSQARPYETVVLPPTPVSPTGEVAETTTEGVTIALLDGGSRRDLGPGLVLSRAGDGAWFVRGHDVATLAAGTAPVHVGTLPARSNPVLVPQPGNRILISGDTGTSLWDPRSGTGIVLPGPSGPPEVLGAATTSIVWTRDLRPDQPMSAIEVTDTTTGRTRHVPLSPALPNPIGYGPPTPRSDVAPNGTGLVVGGFLDWSYGTYYADLRTGRTHAVLDGAEPLAWSPDGQWLAVVNRGLLHGGAEAFLARLWSPRGSVVPVARATAYLDAATAALIP